jgi:hypothetical protein
MAAAEQIPGPERILQMISRIAMCVGGACAVLAVGCSSSPDAPSSPSSHTGHAKATPTATAAEDPGTAPAATGECSNDALASATTPCPGNPDPCNLHSGFDGDEYCILPPPAGKGIQIHFGPKNYTDPAELAKYTIQPGEEFNAYGLANIDALGDNYYNYTQIRMRPGSHHLINQLVTGDAVMNMPEGYIQNGSVGCPGTPVGGFPGTQNLIRNMPPGGKQAPENVGLGSKLAGGSKLCLNHHAYNFNSDVPQLREIWINVWFVDESEVTQKTSPVTIIAGPWQPIAPHTQKVLTSSATVSGEGRIINLFGHRHAWTDRFATWKNDELIYDSWNWQESVAFDYYTLTKNPSLDAAAKADGAVSGMLPVTTGDKINIECDIDNQSENTLTFKNELYTGEMCILFGSAVGVGIRGGTLPGMGAATAQ